jgi:hypothetical protein
VNGNAVASVGVVGDDDIPEGDHPMEARSAARPHHRLLLALLLAATLAAVPAAPVLAADTEASPATAPGASAGFERFEWLDLGEDEDALRSAVMDPAGRFAYFATDTAPSRVVKIDLASFTRIGAIELPDGPLRAAVIDPAGRYAYFGGQTRVVKVDLQSFTRVGALPIADVSSAVMDPAGRYAYFGTDTAPGQVVKIDLRTFTRVGALTLRGGENRLATAVIDPAGRYAYFGTVGVAWREPARIVKVDLANLSRVGALTLTVRRDPEEESLDISESSLGAAVIDSAGRYAYFGTDSNLDLDDRTNGETVVKVDLATFTRAGSRRVTGAGLGSAAIDQAGRYAYFGSDDREFDPAQVVRIDLATFGSTCCTQPAGRQRSLGSAVIDPAGQYVFFGTRPGHQDEHGGVGAEGGRRVLRVALSPEPLPSLGSRLAASYTTTEGWAAHLAADVDGDGRADLLSFHPKRGRWWVSTGRANGTFASPRLAATYATTAGWQAHLAADVDGDGRADLLSYHPDRGRWWVSRGRADGTFASPRLAATYATTAGWQAHLAADVDGDGRADLISHHAKRGRWLVSPSLGDGTFGAPRRLVDHPAGAGWAEHLAADVDGDGRADLLAYDATAGSWVVFADRVGSSDPWRLKASGAIGYATKTGWQTHLAADVTGDGRADLLSYLPRRGRWSVTTSRDDAWFDDPRTLTTYGTTTGWQTHLAADVTGDGRAELLSYHPARGRWWISKPAA